MRGGSEEEGESRGGRARAVHTCVDTQVGNTIWYVHIEKTGTGALALPFKDKRRAMEIEQIIMVNGTQET
eukprot:scaffold3617_cov163-Skeletonema_menzelii.AAC.4